ncbi:hypothetical protein SAMN06265795_11431 [Noviherbaspirillum humi]|uniref:Uncharacterized protein n=1 Tax=Noviherbaspirillum humi TaxID=1688639 RepID=A0A239K0Q0_9BURK|nr:hypothetical protein [Noviherbaspirillum humi]SNT10634.1 hypothetical protein SAMN06265795_11431 [Noviherbaspirillum humi]
MGNPITSQSTKPTVPNQGAFGTPQSGTFPQLPDFGNKKPDEGQGTNPFINPSSGTFNIYGADSSSKAATTRIAKEQAAQEDTEAPSNDAVSPVVSQSQRDPFSELKRQASSVGLYKILRDYSDKTVDELNQQDPSGMLKTAADLYATIKQAAKNVALEVPEWVKSHEDMVRFIRENITKLCSKNQDGTFVNAGPFQALAEICGSIGLNLGIARDRWREVFGVELKQQDPKLASVRELFPKGDGSKLNNLSFKPTQSNLNTDAESTSEIDGGRDGISSGTPNASQQSNSSQQSTESQPTQEQLTKEQRIKKDSEEIQGLLDETHY